MSLRKLSLFTILALILVTYQNCQKSFQTMSFENSSLLNQDLGSSSDDDQNPNQQPQPSPNPLPLPLPTPQQSGERKILISESFDDNQLSSRKWYDNISPIFSTTNKFKGNSALEFLFQKGQTVAIKGGAIRKDFSPTDSIYISFYIKYSSNWVGSNVNYHPHQFHFLTTMDAPYGNLSKTHMTAYVEENEGRPLISFQDSLNVDTNNINKDLTQITEDRAVAGCNGDSDGYGNGTCYILDDGNLTYANGKSWKTSQVYFSDSPGKYYKADWHHIEAFIKLNSIFNNKGQKDGIIWYKYDGETLIQANNVMFRTAKSAAMNFNQFVLAPYIGIGSPIEQIFWVDELVIANLPP